MASKEPKYTTQKHREWVTVTLTKIKSDVGHIKEKANEQEGHLSKLNDRVRKNENKISAITGIGSLLAVMFGSVFAFLFDRN